MTFTTRYRPTPLVPAVQCDGDAEPRPGVVVWGNTGQPPNGQEDVPYSYGFGMAPGSDGEFTFGSLPPGLSETSDGVISGTPTTAGTYEFDVTLTNSAGIHVRPVILVIDP